MRLTVAASKWRWSVNLISENTQLVLTNNSTAFGVTVEAFVQEEILHVNDDQCSFVWLNDNRSVLWHRKCYRPSGIATSELVPRRRSWVYDLINDIKINVHPIQSWASSRSWRHYRRLWGLSRFHWQRVPQGWDTPGRMQELTSYHHKSGLKTVQSVWSSINLQVL